MDKSKPTLPGKAKPLSGAAKRKLVLERDKEVSKLRKQADKYFKSDKSKPIDETTDSENQSVIIDYNSITVIIEQHKYSI